MRKSKNRAGGGARTNLNGLKFEDATDFATDLRKNAKHLVVFQKLKKSKFVNSAVKYKNIDIALVTEKNDFYASFLKKNGVNWKDRISKKLLPFTALINLASKTVYIIEKRYQAGNESVDRKLQACKFKKMQYQKLLEGTGFKLKYIYLLGNHFKEPKYKDVQDYIESVGCQYFFDSIPFEEIGLDIVVLDRFLEYQANDAFVISG